MLNFYSSPLKLCLTPEGKPFICLAYDVLEDLSKPDLVIDHYDFLTFSIDFDCSQEKPILGLLLVGKFCFVHYQFFHFVKLSLCYVQ